MQDSTLYYLIKSLRPQQWLKNLALYAALVFSGFFFYVPTNGVPYFFTVTFAFIIFCLLTSTVYLINDIIDRKADQQHPFKKKRPIASGKLPVPTAIAFICFANLLVLLLSFWLSLFFRLTIITYFVLQILYAFITKHIPVLDVLSIAAGFLLRIYAGAVVVDLHMSVWFLLTVISASLFLAVGKRQSERTLMEGKELGETRKSLKLKTTSPTNRYCL
jgi:4-hydroxybenzoate polyprenyltransferase